MVDQVPYVGDHLSAGDQTEVERTVVGERTGAEAAAAVHEIRRVLDGLRPGALDLHGLEGAVRDTASSLGMGRPGAPAFELLTLALPLLPPSIEEAAFRIVAESLTNVVRHSTADHCAVHLHQVNGDLRIRVTDDGSWLDAAPGAGHGLDSMRRRAADVGGGLNIDPAEPRGTVVTAVLPLGRPDMTLRIVVADDHPMYRYGLTAVLDQAEAWRWWRASATAPPSSRPPPNTCPTWSSPT